MATPRAAAKKKAQKTLTQEMSALLAKTFLPDLALRARQPAIERALLHRWQAEREGKRTAADFDEWVSATVEQVGAAWILSCVFVRVLEDRGLLDRRRIAGEGAEGQQAEDSLQQFLEIAPSLTERDYLLTVFRELATYPGAADVLDPAHNPAWRLSPSNDSVRALLMLLRETDSDGKLRFAFRPEETRDTRFLGDLYQNLSESVRKRHALLQTPDFVERFILDQTLEPAITEFGLDGVRLIDPTCGSGHFLLGAFHRLFEHRQRQAPALDRREHAKSALAQVYGVDVNPYAVAIARFRLTLAYLEHAGIDQEGWPRERLIPILAGILELVPWLKQWHNEPNPTYDGQRIGEVYEAFVLEKVRALPATLDELRAWRPDGARNGKAKAKSKTTGSRKRAPVETDAEAEDETVTS